MSGERGIGLDDLTRIERDQFVHYVEMERHLGDPANWTAFRVGLLRALEAAFGWDPVEPGAEPEHRLGVLDELRATHDPSTHWDAFFDALWEARGSLR